MLARFASRSALGLVVLATLSVLSCERSPLLAPTGSTIVLTTTNTAIPTNATLPIRAQVLEATGYPPHSGTRVTFTTTLGFIEPGTSSTDANGQVQVIFRSGGSSGTATIAALSGSAVVDAEHSLKISVGAAAVGRVVINASPANVPSVGGTSTVTANVVDINGNPLTSTPVSFTTTAGVLSQQSVPTDSNGNASTVLSTGQEATVTATVGAGTSGGTGGTGGTTGGTTTGTSTASVVVKVASAPTIIITPPTTVPSVGIPATFTFVVTPATGGAAVRSVTVDWGDGTGTSLGAVTGSQPAAHAYATSGTKTITATVTDASGQTSSVSTSVTVIPVTRPTIVVTPTPANVTAGGNVNFNVQVTVPAGIGVVSTIIDFGDGTSQSLGGATSALVPHTYGLPAGAKLVKVSVIDTTGQLTEGTTNVNVNQ